MKKVFILLIPTLAMVFLILILLKTNTCSIEGEVGIIQICNCKGYEIQIKNDLPFDGSRITICLGLIQPKNNMSKSNKDLSTPDLISRDYLANKISLEQRWLYVVYAIYDYEKLPKAYKSNVAWEGTPYLDEFYNLIENGTVCEFPKDVIAELKNSFPSDLGCK